MSVIFKRLLVNYFRQPKLIFGSVISQNVKFRQFSVSSQFHNHDVRKNEWRLQEDHLNSQSPSFVTFPEFHKYTPMAEILEYLATLPEGSQFDVKNLEKILLRLRLCLVSERIEQRTNPEVYQLFQSEGIKRLCLLLQDQKLAPGALVDAFGIFINLRVHGDHQRVQNICFQLADNIEKMPLHQVKFVQRQIMAMVPINQRAESIVKLKKVIAQRIRVPFKTQPELLTYLTSLNDNITLMQLGDVIDHVDDYFSRRRPAMEKGTSVLETEGIQNLCRLIEREEADDLPDFYLLKFLQILHLLQTTGDDRTMTCVIHRLKDHMENGKVEVKQIKNLEKILNQLSWDSQSDESRHLQKLVTEALE